MTDESKLDYYLREMQFLDEIGERKTVEYETAKKRARELGTILLGQSGETLKPKIDYDKIAQGLSSRVPQSLSVRAGGQSSGGFVGSTQNSAQTTVKLLQDMLSTLQRIAVGVN